MKLRIPLMALVLLCVGASLGWGATTGKITGVITDAATGEAIVGASVLVVGTSLGAQTDVDGRYTIINVPVGTYTLRMSSVGYATLEVSNVSVSVDLTTYQSRALSVQATDIGETIRVTAERPLVMEDKTTTVNIVSREQLLAMPTRGFEQVVGIQNSVVRMNSNLDARQRGFRQALATAPEINLRGGRPSEVAYYVDGFSQQDPLSGISTANINNNAIKEVSVTSGTFSPEYGHVASGIVNVTTNSGGPEYHGNFEAVSDNVAGELGYDAFDHNYYSADLSGPIPGVDEAYFFFSGERRYLGDRQPSIREKDIMEEFGLTDQYDDYWQKPANALSGWSYQGKLDYNLTPQFKIALSANGSIDRWQRYIHQYLNPDFPEQVWHSPRYRDENLGINGKITHTLSANTFYNLSVSYFKTTRLIGDGRVFDDYSAYRREVTNPEYDAYTLIREGNITWASDTSATDALEPGDPGDVVVAYQPSFFNGYDDRRASYIGAKGDITHQLTAANTLRAGFDFQRHTIRRFQDLRPTNVAGFNSQNINYFGFDSLSNEADPSGYQNPTKHPINVGLYANDRLEYRGLIVNMGLRFDYFDYKSKRLKNPARPFDPDGSGVSNDRTIDPTDLLDSKKFTRLSPRIGISFPISDITQMHINYGIFFQRPDLENLYLGYNFLQARVGAGSYYAFPSPNLEPETITQYEIGMTHQLGEFTAFDVTAYYKDVKDLTQIHHQAAVPYAYDYYANDDFATIKGFDFSLTMRRTHNISMSLKYSLGFANGTGSYAQSTYNIAWKNPGNTPKTTRPLDYDQRHSIIGLFDLRSTKGEGPRMGDYYPLENFGLNVIAQLGSGLPYTPTNPYDAASIGKSVSQIPTGPINSAHQPWQISVDLKLERTFDIAGYELVPYVLVKNLFNRENLITVYEGTGEAYSTGYLQTAEGETRSSDATPLLHYHTTAGEQFAYRYRLAENNPTNYLNPRLIMVGLRLSF